VQFRICVHGPLAVNTIQNALKALYAWQSYYGIDVLSHFSRCELLQTPEVHSLRDFMQKPLLDENDENDEKIVSISRRSKTVSTSNQYARMSVIADTLASCLASINCRLVLLAVTVPSEWLRRSKPAAPRLL
jgi:hypothetical protein